MNDLTDLTDRLRGLDATGSTPSEDVVAADVSRAGAALTRRRRTRAALGSVALTLALGGGLGIAVVAQGDDPSEPPIARDGVEPVVGLVAYEGEQPEGFEVAVIPEGFFVQGSDPYVFTVARDGDTSHPLAFEDKLVVSLEDGIKKQGDIEGEPVMVGDVEGGLRSNPDGMATTLEFLQGDFDVVVQMWSTVGLTDEQLIEFAEGITVTEDAEIPGAPTGDSPRVRVERRGGNGECLMRREGDTIILRGDCKGAVLGNVRRR